MKKHFIIIILCLLLAGCSQPIAYNGDTFAKTKRTDIYYSTSEVNRPYKVIGHIKSHKYSANIVREDLIRFGKRIGADAVIILGTDSVQPNRITAEAIKYN